MLYRKKMRLLLVIVLLCVLQAYVIGKSIVKRQCNTCNSNCNDCCSSNCQSNCNNNCRSCSSNCNTNEKEREPVLVPFPQQNPSGGESTNNTNINKYNFTADITLTNEIHTVNNVSIPININSTNVNKVYVYPANNTVTTSTGTDKCCIVVYPRTCDSNGCYVRRQRECSDICTSEVVVVPTTAPVTCPVAPTCPPPPVWPTCPPPPPMPTVPPTQSPPTPCPTQPPCALPPSPCYWNQISRQQPIDFGFQGYPQTWIQQPNIGSVRYSYPAPPVYPSYQGDYQGNYQVDYQGQGSQGWYPGGYPGGCQGSYPFSPCRRARSINCDGCFTCNGEYNPEKCALSSVCPTPCGMKK